jgi:hypothetical protein
MWQYQFKYVHSVSWLSFNFAFESEKPSLSNKKHGLISWFIPISFNLKLYSRLFRNFYFYDYTPDVNKLKHSKQSSVCIPRFAQEQKTKHDYFPTWFSIYIILILTPKLTCWFTYIQNSCNNVQLSL